MEDWRDRIHVIRSRRKTIGLQIKGDEVLVRVPLHATHPQIEEVLQKHEKWIKTHLERAKQSREEAGEAGRLTMEEIRALADRALKEIPPRVRYYASLMGVTYGRITIRNQRSRWGSCSQKGNLNFNCLLMLCPPEVVDSVVVHELAHRKEMNHSKAFYAEIQKVFPDYDKWNRWLKEHGPGIMRRMTG